MAGALCYEQHKVATQAVRRLLLLPPEEKFMASLEEVRNAYCGPEYLEAIDGGLVIRRPRVKRLFKAHCPLASAQSDAAPSSSFVLISA